MNNSRNDESTTIKKFSLIFEKKVFEDLKQMSGKYRRMLYKKMDSHFRPSLTNNSYQRYFLYPDKISDSPERTEWILNVMLECLVSVINTAIAEMEVKQEFINTWKPTMTNYINTYETINEQEAL